MLLLHYSRVVLVVVPNGTSKKSLEEICDLLMLRNSRVVLVVVPNGQTIWYTTDMRFSFLFLLPPPVFLCWNV